MLPQRSAFPQKEPIMSEAYIIAAIDVHKKMLAVVVSEVKAGR